MEEKQKVLLGPVLSFSPEPGSIRFAVFSGPEALEKAKEWDARMKKEFPNYPQSELSQSELSEGK